MIKILDSTKKNFYTKLNKLLNNRRIVKKSNLETVQKIINNVRKNKDRALVYYEKKFNSNSNIIPSKKQIKQAIKLLDPKVKKAIDDAYKRIKEWHSKQKIKDIYYKDKLNNKFYYRTVAISDVAVYVPSGLPSCLLMCATPAVAAGVKRIVILTPSVDGKLNPSIMYAASKLGLNEIYAVSGASAIAAAAYGTPKIKPVSKIVGAGSLYTSLAKKLVSLEGVCGSESAFLGPSEILVWADNSVTANEVASSCIAQSEHSENSMAIVITKSKKLINEVKISLLKQLKDLPRKAIAKRSLKNNGALIYASSDNSALSILERCAPEHVELCIKNYKKYMYQITNAGSIVLGKYGSMSMSDYFSQHQLPTHGSARYSSGLGVKDFVKQISYNEMQKKGIEKIAETGYVLSQEEKLFGHSRSIKIKMRRK